jgi:hypothetical protein
MAGAGGAGGMAVTGEGVQDEDAVGAGSIQLTPRLVGDHDIGKLTPPFKGEPLPAFTRQGDELAPTGIFSG